MAFPFSSHPPVVLGVSAAAEQSGPHADPHGSLHQPPVLSAGEGFDPTICMFLARLALQSKNECPYPENKHSGVGFDTALSSRHVDML